MKVVIFLIVAGLFYGFLGASAMFGGMTAGFALFLSALAGGFVAVTVG